ncbi:MAG: M15 family metallopeptidase [Cetobacterium sp.]
MKALAESFLYQCEQAGIPCEIVAGGRSIDEQAKVYAQGRTQPGEIVSNAKPGLSYHNYGLAFDAVPKVYLHLHNWNPEGPLWARIGAIGQGLGLEWGGSWTSKDLPHFQLTAAPIRQLKAYWDKFRQVMPVGIEPSDAGLALAAGLAGIWLAFFRPKLKKAKML